LGLEEQVTTQRERRRLVLEPHTRMERPQETKPRARKLLRVQEPLPPLVKRNHQL